MKRPVWLVAGHYAMLVVLAFLCIAPILVIFATGLRQQVQIFAEPLNFIFMPTLENYRAVLQEDKFDRYLWNSLSVGITSTVITLVLGGFASWGAPPWPTPRCSCAPCRWPCWPFRCS
jgi:multiple sugar transport system permease protein